MSGMNLLEISQTIRRVRLAQGMTVEQLAKKSGFSKGFISQVENFRQSPSLKALVRLTEALGLPMSALFARDGEGAPPYTQGRIDAGEEVVRDDGAKFGIRCVDAQNSTMTVRDKVGYFWRKVISGRNEWTEYTMDFTTPDEIKSINFYFQIANKDGECCWDDISIVEIQP